MMDETGCVNINHAVVYDIAGLRARLVGRRTGSEILYSEIVDSTNLAARRALKDGYGEGTVIIADTQTAGRGRLGRSWFSPAAKGIWMSVLISPKAAPADSGIIAIAAAVAAADGIYAATGIRTGIKWPNDLLFDGRKVCGILTETSVSGMDMDYMIVGIGVNCYQNTAEFPDGLAGSAVSLIECHPETMLDRTAITAEILLKFEEYCIKGIPGNVSVIKSKWEEYCIMHKRAVTVISGGRKVTGTVIGLDDGGALMIGTADGRTVRIVSGEAAVLKEGDFR